MHMNGPPRAAREYPNRVLYGLDVAKRVTRSNMTTIGLRARVSGAQTTHNGAARNSLYSRFFIPSVLPHSGAMVGWVRSQMPSSSCQSGHIALTRMSVWRDCYDAV